MSARERHQAMAALLRSSVHGRRREMTGLAAWSAVQALPAFLSGLLIARAIDSGFLGGSLQTGFAWLAVLALGIVVGAWATRQTYLRLAAVVEPFRDELVRRVVAGTLRRSTVPGAAPDASGAARVTHHVEIVREAYASVLMVTQSFVVAAAGALLGLLTMLPLVLVLVLPPVVVGLGLFFAALPGMAARQRDSILADERVGDGASTISRGLRDIVACGAEAKVAAGVGEAIDAQARATRALARFTAWRTTTVAIGGWLPLVLILVGGPWLLRNGASTGEIVGALTYVAQGLHPALQTLVNGIGNTGLWLYVTLGRIVEVAGEPQTADAHGARRRRSLAPRDHELRLRHVTFGYGRSPQPVIDALDLVVPDGDHLVVVGPSGAGKSTLAGLIAGLLTPQSGDIRLGQVRIGDLDPQTAAEQRVLIPQEAYVFAGTLRENLAYLHPAATTGQLDDAVRRLGVESLALRLGGYDAELEPDRLSGGERQLVTLARAYVSPARLVLLDEATCHLDPAAEAIVEHAFAQRPGTLIVIAHRISSALRAQRVLVLDGGRALVGTHEDLLLRSPLYRDLVGHWNTVPAPHRAPPPAQPAPHADRRPRLEALTALTPAGRALTRRGK